MVAILGTRKNQFLGDISTCIRKRALFFSIAAVALLYATGEFSGLEIHKCKIEDFEKQDRVL
jgi:hypothetical protein